MENRNDFTDRYGPRYVVETYDDGITYLQTHHPDRNGITYDVYRYSCTHLAACLPPKAAIHCRKKHPEHFTIHQNAQDAIVLCFEESMLHELAGIRWTKSNGFASSKQVVDSDSARGPGMTKRLDSGRSHPRGGPDTVGTLATILELFSPTQVELPSTLTQ
jgi:hypothetical protein